MHVHARLTPARQLRLFAESRFEAIRAIRVFREKYLKPAEDGLLSPSDRENALLTLYRRQVAVLQSVALIGGPVHFQMLAAAARTIFEVGVDIALIAKDKTNESARRLDAFAQVERLRVSEKLVSFYANHKPPGTLDIALHQSIANDVVLRNRAKAWVIEFWPNKKTPPEKHRPTHWSANGELRARAKALDSTPDARWEGRYVEVYPTLSWHIHGGAVGILGMSVESFEAVAATAYGVIIDVMIDSFQALGQELQWAKGMPEWKDRLEFLSAVTTAWYTELLLKENGEQPRFDFLEEDETRIWANA